MRWLLGALAATATRWPRSALGVLAAVTLGMGALATSLEVEVDLAQLGSEDSAPGQTMDRVREDFADPTAAVQVIVDAGPGGNVLTTEGIEALRTAERVAVAALGEDVRTDEEGQPPLLSVASAIEQALAQRGPGAAGAGEQRIEAAARRVLAANPQLAGLVSDDVDPDAGTARAAVAVVPLDPDLTEPQRSEAGQAVETAFERARGGPLADMRVTVFSSGLFVDGLLDAIRAEVPLLFLLALLVVVTILALMYRSVFDVVVGLAGLFATVLWTLGFAALLGPAHLGWTGPLTQFVVVIPVLLVGLGIDYSVHLTARYREQRAAGEGAGAAARRALHTVGAALVLATAATGVGFGSIAIAPLPMLADFGVFVAVGVVCAFLQMGLVVPAARVWWDRRAAAPGGGAVRELGLGGLMRAPAWTARRAPAAGLIVAALLVVASLFAATGLDVDFDRDDFVPEGSDIEAALAHQAELFGGGVTESTYVVFDGDLTDPAVADAVWEAQTAAGDIAGVRTVGGIPQVVSVLSMAMTVLEDGQGAPGNGETGDGFAADADLRTAYELLRRSLGARVDQLLAPDAQSTVVQIRTTAGDAGAMRLQREIEAAFAPVEESGAAVAVTSEPIIIAEMSEDLGAFQAQSIGLTLAVVSVLLVAYYAVVCRRWLLGAIAMLPAVVSAALIFGTMWLLGISFNVLTATLTAIAVGIGVPYGVHVVNRFVEDLDDGTGGCAAARTLRATGSALVGSGLTTLGAFTVLAFSDLPPMRSLGLLGGTGIAVALLTATLVEPGALVLWANRRNHPVATVRKLPVAAGRWPSARDRPRQSSSRVVEDGAAGRCARSCRTSLAGGARTAGRAGA